MSDLIRLGVKKQLDDACRRCEDIARSDQSSGRQKLMAIEFLRTARWAEFADVLPPERMEEIRADIREERSSKKRLTKPDEAVVQSDHPISESERLLRADPGVMETVRYAEEGKRRKARQRTLKRVGG